jgi:hypothetical protein
VNRDLVFLVEVAHGAEALKICSAMMFLICDKRKSSLLFHAIWFLLHASCFSIYATVRESFVSFLLLLAIVLWEGLPLS